MGLLRRLGCFGCLLCAGVKRRFMAGKTKRPAIGGRGLCELEHWNIGTLEYWVGHAPRRPFHYSIVPPRRRPLVGGSFVFPLTQDVTSGAGRRKVRGEAWYKVVAPAAPLNRLLEFRVNSRDMLLMSAPNGVRCPDCAPITPPKPILAPKPALSESERDAENAQKKGTTRSQTSSRFRRIVPAP